MDRVARSMADDSSKRAVTSPTFRTALAPTWRSASPSSKGSDSETAGQANRSSRACLQACAVLCSGSHSAPANKRVDAPTQLWCPRSSLPGEEVTNVYACAISFQRSARWRCCRLGSCCCRNTGLVVDIVVLEHSRSSAFPSTPTASSFAHDRRTPTNAD